MEVPMVRSPWIIKTDRLSVAFKVYGARTSKEIEVEICKNPGISDVITTVKRGSAICPLCGYTTPAENVRKQFLDKRGGANDSRLMAVVTLSEGVRDVRLPQKHDYDAFVQAKGKLSDLILAEPKATPSLIPDEPLPYLRSIFNIQLLGVKSWGDLFNARQALAIATLASKVKALSEKQFKLKDVAFGRALKTILAFAVDRQADSNTSLCSWRSSSQDIGHTFGRQALPIVWDYVECNLFSGATRDWSNAVEGTLKAINGVIGIKTCGEAHRASATQQSLPDDSSAIFFTDPPYYDLVPYADLSDFFYVWLKRMIAEEYPELFSDDLTPKLNEIVQLAERNPTYAYKTRENYEGLMCKAMQDSRRVLQPCGIGIVVFAHKGTDVWEIQLDAMIRAGWIICASWPIDTEMGSRLRARNSAALASSVHLICRPRENFDGSLHTTDIGDWRDVLRELPERIHEWLPRLADEGVVGADAIFACLGPALEVFSRYSRVEKASGEVVTLREYLEQVWAAVSKEALALVFKDADTSGFEEDARLTAMWLWTLSANQTTDHTDDTEEEDEEESGEEGNRKKVVSGGYTLEYDAARKIAQGLGAHLEALTSLVEVKGDKATLLPVMARTRKLFGKEDTSIQDRQAEKKAKKAKAKQMDMFVTLEQLESELAQETGSVADTAPAAGSTTLDRVHQTMILFGAGRSEAMKRFLVDDGIGNDPRFWSLAQALSALYPPTTEEKRWVDGVLARKKGLGF
ncbi:MAG: DUF1156 domain-containing protein [Candidatus Hydrogenedentes bacterium]|nr:DUF1156 domain-containing protein [Candidatus Hydrogenedentota bacterium]